MHKVLEQRIYSLTDNELSLPRLLRVAVSAEGSCPEVCVQGEGSSESSAVVLDHRGPSAQPPDGSRPVGASELKALDTQRRSRALSESEWLALKDAYVLAAEHASKAHPSNTTIEKPLGLSIFERGLLHTALSPISQSPAISQSEREGRVFAIANALRAYSPFMLLCVDELCPKGIDATRGQSFVRALCDAGASAIFACTGSAYLPALKERARASQNPAQRFLHAATPALLAAGQTPVYVRGFCDEGPESFLQKAQARGFYGVLFDAQTFAFRKGCVS